MLHPGVLDQAKEEKKSRKRARPARIYDEGRRLIFGEQIGSKIVASVESIPNTLFMTCGRRYEYPPFGTSTPIADPRFLRFFDHLMCGTEYFSRLGKVTDIDKNLIDTLNR